MFLCSAGSVVIVVVVVVVVIEESVRSDDVVLSPDVTFMVLVDVEA